MATVFLCNWGSRDQFEINSLGGSISTTNPHSGNAVLVQAATATILKGSLNSATSIIRFYFLKPTNPGADQIICQFRTSTPTSMLAVVLTSSGNIKITDSSGTMGLSDATGSTTLSDNAWYAIQVAVNCAAGGLVRVAINNVNEHNVTHSNLVNNVDRWQFTGAASPNQYRFANIRIDTGSTTAITDSLILYRAGTAGTPTNDDGTKVGKATAALCWSDVPKSTTNNVTLNANGQNQTMLVEDFALASSVFGNEHLSPNDTIRTSIIKAQGKSSTGHSASGIRRIVGGVATNSSAISLGTTDGLFDTVLSSIPSYANSHTLEIGVFHGNNANTDTWEDIYWALEFAQAALTFTPTVGSLTPTGVAPLLDYQFITTVGSLALTGVAPSLDLGIKPTVTALALTGVAPSLDLGIKPTVATDLAITGVAPIFDFGFITTVGSFTLTGIAPSIYPSISPSVGSLALTGVAPSLDLGITPTVATDLAITGVAPSLDYQFITTVGTLVLTEAVPTLDLTITPTVATDLAVTGVAPKLDLGITPSVASLILTGDAPSLDTKILTDVGLLTLTEDAPTLDLAIFPDEVDLALSGETARFLLGPIFFPEGILTLSSDPPVDIDAFINPSADLEFTTSVPLLAFGVYLVTDVGDLVLDRDEVYLDTGITPPASPTLTIDLAVPLLDFQYLIESGILTLTSDSYPLLTGPILRPTVSSINLTTSLATIDFTIFPLVSVDLAYEGERPTVNTGPMPISDSGFLVLTFSSPSLDLTLGISVVNLSLTGFSPVVYIDLEEDIIADTTIIVGNSTPMDFGIPIPVM